MIKMTEGNTYQGLHTTHQNIFSKHDKKLVMGYQKQKKYFERENLIKLLVNSILWTFIVGGKIWDEEREREREKGRENGKEREQKKNKRNLKMIEF